jgi:hypothetical protein
VSTGALTYSFIQAVQNEPGLTYGRLLNSMRYAIREAKTGIRLNGPIASFVNRLLCMELSQVLFTYYMYKGFLLMTRINVKLNQKKKKKKTY